MLLADLACENEGFRGALLDYEAALDLLTHSKPVSLLRSRVTETKKAARAEEMRECKW